MSFQSSVAQTQGFGVVGEIFTSSPTCAKSFILNSGAVPNKIGYAYTRVSEGQAKCGGAGAFAGILINPKGYALQGAAAGTLAPTLTVPEDSQGELLTMGEVIVYLTTAAAIGAAVYYVDADGSLGAGTAGAGQTQIPNAKVSRYTLGAAGLATIELTN